MNGQSQTTVDGDPAANGGAWWKRAVIYQIYPLSFQDSDADGRGDLAGALARLDHLSLLGADALWIGPIFASPMADHGYDVSDFAAVDPVFGSMEDFNRLTDSLHERGMRLILDFIPNHTSDQHPWFQQSRSSRDSPARDWYVWADPAADGGPPNNWLSRFGGSAWEWDAATGQYYYHAFLKEQPDLNWRHTPVRAQMAEVLRCWMRRGVDGFRIDAAAVLAEDELLRDDPPNHEADAQTPPPDRFERRYTNYRPEVLDWLAELRAVVDEFPGRVLLGEVDGAGPSIADFYGDAQRPLVHLPLNYRLLDTPWNALALKTMIDEYLSVLPLGAWPDWLAGSPDKKRVVDQVGDPQARLAALLLLTLPGTVVIYAGDELGMRGARIRSADSRDPFEHRVPGYDLNRDPERSPMQWDGSSAAGFTRGTPWLPLADDHAHKNVAVEQQDPRSMLALYRQLIALRHAHRVLAEGTYERAFADGDLLGYTRVQGDCRWQVLLNLGREPRSWRLPPGTLGRLLLSSHLDRVGEAALGGVQLRGCEGLVLEIPSG